MVRYVGELVHGVTVVEVLRQWHPSWKGADQLSGSRARMSKCPTGVGHPGIPVDTWIARRTLPPRTSSSTCWAMCTWNPSAVDQDVGRCVDERGLCARSRDAVRGQAAPPLKRDHGVPGPRAEHTVARAVGQVRQARQGALERAYEPRPDRACPPAR